MCKCVQMQTVLADDGPSLLAVKASSPQEVAGWVKGDARGFVGSTVRGASRSWSCRPQMPSYRRPLDGLSVDVRHRRQLIFSSQNITCAIRLATARRSYHQMGRAALKAQVIFSRHGCLLLPSYAVAMTACCFLPYFSRLKCLSALPLEQ